MTKSCTESDAAREDLPPGWRCVEYPAIPSRLMAGYKNGDLHLEDVNLDDCVLPARITGSLSIRGCKVENLKFPEVVEGCLILSNLNLTNCVLPLVVNRIGYVIKCNTTDTAWPTVMFGKPGRVIALSTGYPLWATDDGLFYAGCRWHLSLAEGLKHWGSRTDERAVLFTMALKEFLK